MLLTEEQKQRIHLMISPVIIMNSTDYENILNDLKKSINNFKESENPTYEGVTLKHNTNIQAGTIAIYDENILK